MMAYRIAMHRVTLASLPEVLCGMSIDDVVEAHGFLDALDERARHEERK